MKLKGSGLDIEKLQDLVRSNDKQRYGLILEGPDGEILEDVCSDQAANSDTTEKSATLHSPLKKKKGVWLIRARQGHSMKVRMFDYNLQEETRLYFIECPTRDEAYSFT
jgi:hypothetical protein